MLIIVCGLPGSGKTSISKMLAKRFSAAHINSDVVRKRIFEKPAYTDEEKRKVYLAMADEAGKSLKEKNVILDATFYRKEYREMARKAAEKAGTDAYIIVCELGERETQKRMEEREMGPSDADFEVYLKLKETFEPVDGEHLKIDCSLPKKEIMKRIEEFLEGAGKRL